MVDHRRQWPCLIIWKVRDVSRADWFATLATKACAHRVALAATPAEDLYRFRRPPVECRSSHGNAAATAKPDIRRISPAAARARYLRWCWWLEGHRGLEQPGFGNWLEGCIATATAELHALGKARLAFCATNNNQSSRVHSTGETAAL